MNDRRHSFRQRWRARAYAVAALGLLLTSSGIAGTVATPSAASDSEIHRMLVTRVDIQKRATGIVLGIVGPNGKRVIAYGTLALGDKRPADGNTVFDIGSITKVFTALLLCDMAQRGEVALDDPVSKYLPADLRLPAPNGKQITLADLATHTSGLPLRPTNLVSKDPDNKYAGYSVDLLYQFLSSFVPTRDAGGRYEYSNVGYGLLGQALSRRAGKSFPDLLGTRVTQPLDLRDTRIDLTPEMKRRLATGYSNELTPAPAWDLGALASAGALRSTANDLLKLLDAFLGYKKSGLALAMHAMLETRRPGGMPPSSEIALAWNILSDNGQEIAWKNGSVGGYRAFLAYDRKARVGVVALANAQTAVGADDIGLHLLDSSRAVDLSVPRAHKEITVDPTIFDRYVGRYQYSPSDIIIVTRDGDHLSVQAPGPDKLELFVEGEHDFFLKAIDAQITFESSGTAPATAAIWHQAGQTQRGERIK